MASPEVTAPRREVGLLKRRSRAEASIYLLTTRQGEAANLASTRCSSSDEPGNPGALGIGGALCLKPPATGGHHLQRKMRARHSDQLLAEPDGGGLACLDRLVRGSDESTRRSSISNIDQCVDDGLRRPTTTSRTAAALSLRRASIFGHQLRQFGCSGGAISANDGEWSQMFLFSAAGSHGLLSLSTSCLRSLNAFAALLRVSARRHDTGRVLKREATRAIHVAI